jgi:DNA-binding NarL/FixJ family response regulator
MAVSFHPRVLLIERQTLFTPFLVRLLEGGGARVSVAAPEQEPLRLQRLRPDVICVDVDHLDEPPFAALRRLRTLLPGSRIVAYTHAAESAWRVLAKSFGADVVLGPDAQVSDLLAAVRQPRPA